MIWIDCNPQAGREMRDMHPLVVLSPREFNERTGIVIGLPMTTASYNETNPFAVKFTSRKGVVSFILSHQPKSFRILLKKFLKIPTLGPARASTRSSTSAVDAIKP
jgi:mRNA-degrading endonuclease toxin of MazEF toxin-antitoxin module